MRAAARGRRARAAPAAARGDGIRALAEQLAASTEVCAMCVAGADLSVVLPGDDAPSLHLRPACVEHLLAVDRLWPAMDPADRQVLTSCYTPRDTPHVCWLQTLYLPLADGPAPGDSEGAAGGHRRLRPLRPAELMELLRVYVVRRAQPAAATLSLPRAPPHDARAAELRTHADDEVLSHVYCTLAPPSGGVGTAYILQLLTKEGAEPPPADEDVSSAAPPLVELLPTLQAALKISPSSIRLTGLQPLNLTLTSLTSSLAGAAKAQASHAELKAALATSLDLAAAF